MKTQMDIEGENFMMSTEKLTKEYHESIQKGTLSGIKGSTQVLQHFKDILSDELIKATEEAKNGKAAPRRVANQLIMVLGAEVIAHYTVNCIVNVSGLNVPYASIVSKLSKTLRKEFRLHEAKDDDKENFKFITTLLKKKTHSNEVKLGIAGDLIRKYQNFPKLKREQKFDTLALYCLEYLAHIRPTIRGHVFDNLFEVRTIPTGKDKFIQSIFFCTWFKQYLKDNIENGNLVPSHNTPLIEEPIKWNNFRGGGFHSEHFKYNVVSRGRSRDYKYSDLENVYKTLNKLQGTSLKVNKKVYEIFEHSVRLNLGLGGLPRNESPAFIEYPFKGRDFKDLNEDEQKIVRDWAKNKTAMHRSDVSNNSKYMKMYRTLVETKRFKDYEKLYFAYYVDYRGRIYPKANALSPQGDKYSKALLQFSEGKRIDTRDAEMFLAMHGANTYGEDKISFEEKHLLILNMHEAILACAKNPLDSDAIWHLADDPWNFLAFCFEWEQYSREGSSFKSHLSIAMDGSCNGLQHLSAMFLDEVGGKSVNLTNNPTKGDIYSDVQALTIKLLSDRGTSIGKKLVEINAITRNSCKKPVMTVPYAGTKMGTRDSVRLYLEDNMLLKHFKPEDRTQVIGQYTDALWDAIELTIIKGRDIMKFLKTSAPLILKASTLNTIQWYTPNGFKVVQRKPNLKKIQANTLLGEFVGNKRAMVQLQYAMDTPSSRKHGNSIAPNLIHSLDACHLQNTVLSLEDGVSFNMIHDSYGTHASDSRAMYEAIRQQFYDIYKNNNVLQRFIEDQPEFKLPDLPTNGKLDLTEVLDSEYFFA